MNTSLAHSGECCIPKAKTPRKFKQAEAAGAVTKLPKTMALITGKDHSKALTPLENETAYIQPLQEGFIESLEFDPTTGRMHVAGRHLEEVTVRDLRTREVVKDLDLPLLRSLYSAFFFNTELIQGGEISVYLPALCHHLGIDIQTGKPADLFKKILSFRDVVGVRGRSFYKLLDFASYDAESNIITFSSPYMNAILREIEGFPAYVVQQGKRKFQKPSHSFLVHGTIAKERNKLGVEIALLIVTLLEQRGTDKRKPVTTLRKKCSGIVAEIPLFQTAYEAQRSTADKNQVLRRAFTAAYDILKRQTDIYQRFQDLRISEIIPTTSTLENSLVITHKGKERGQ